MKEGKAFQITQTEVLEAYKAVKANGGAGGVDGVELETFDKDWKNRLYKLWNRMASGSYFPKAVRGVEIPKKNGKKRLLGIPTIEDRVAQMVLKKHLEPKAELYFYNSSLDIVRTNPHWMQLVRRDRIVSDIIGLWNLILLGFLTISITICCLR